ncbi:hypothetical protein BJV74DRAFT_33274 [Russula compacta]|nr:hypothetical protein BJV74DRAFT_33274 [Russula compacta]
MASLVDPRPNDSSTPPRALDTPPIITTTNVFPSASQRPQIQPQAASVPSTPGLSIPGAYPRDENTGPPPRKKAPEASPSQSYHLSATKATSLPSTEKEGVKPGEHYDGVGPLPGSISETSVAKLPDERLEPAGDPTAGAITGAVSLPSQEARGAQPHEHHEGVGPLPGSTSETSVAKLPDERLENRLPVSDFAALSIAGQGTQVRRVDSRDPALEENIPEQRDGQGTSVKGAAEDSKFKEGPVAEQKRSSFEGKKERGGENYRAADERASPKAQESTGPVLPPPSPEAGAPAQRKGRSSSDSDASNHKKASVMSKVKGEMKVLLGRASRNKEKVEEGEKLKHGSP